MFKIFKISVFHIHFGTENIFDISKLFLGQESYLPPFSNQGFSTFGMDYLFDFYATLCKKIQGSLQLQSQKQIK